MKYMKKKFALRTAFVFLLLLSTIFIVNCFAQNSHSLTKEELKNIIKEVNENPTVPENAEERFNILKKITIAILERGGPVYIVLTKEEGEKIYELIKEEKWDEACPKIDKAFNGFGGLFEYAEELKALQEKIESKVVKIPVNSSEVKIISGLPGEEKGADIKEKPTFSKFNQHTSEGFAKVKLSDEPLWIIEGDLPNNKSLTTEESPFGFHPATAWQNSYEYAEHIGVVWDRGGLYLFWVLCEPEPGSGNYEWFMCDNYFREIKPGFEPLKNITVAHDHMLNIPGRPSPPSLGDRPSIDVSNHVEGTTYRPSDEEAYSKWVKAAVERYDGDGIDDMEGLTIPAKYWQIDNEPPRGREGYNDLVRITSKAIKEADPEAKILIGGLILPCPSHQTKRYKDFSLPLIEGLEGKDIDIFDFHWFGHTGEWYFLPEAIKTVRADLEKAGFPDAPIWFTEMGTYSGTPERGGKGNQSEREQASEMIKRYTVSLGEGVDKIFWAWGMKEGFMNENDNEFFDNTGFIYDGIGPNDPGRGVKKIIYWAYGNMTELLNYWDGEMPEKIDIGEGVMAYRFKFKNEDRGIIVAWLYNKK